MEHAHFTLEDLFTVNELTEREDQTLKALKLIYPEFVPIVKIMKPHSKQLPNEGEEQKGKTISIYILEQALVLLMEEHRLYLKVCRDIGIIQKTHDEVHSSDIYVQQLNAKEMELAEYDASKFYSEDSPITQIYIITKIKEH